MTAVNSRLDSRSSAEFMRIVPKISLFNIETTLNQAENGLSHGKFWFNFHKLILEFQKISFFKKKLLLAEKYCCL